MRELRRGLAHQEEKRQREQHHPQGEQGQMDQLDDVHIASGSGQRRGRRGIREVGFGTVIVVVPAVVQSHPPSVAQAPRRTGARGTDVRSRVNRSAEAEPSRRGPARDVRRVNSDPR